MSSSLFLSIILLAQSVFSANEIGPTAPVSISSERSYQLARTCAACCLWYIGVYPPGFQGYYDLAIALSCGATARNGCYCKADYASSASAYISSCVSGECAAIGDVTKDLKTMMDLYNGYCKTANVEVSTTPVELAASTGAAPSTKGSATRTSVVPTGVQRKALSSSNSQPVATSNPAAGTTGTSTNSSALGKSDVIAIGVGLGIGVPSLLLGLATFCVQMRRRKQRIEKEGLLDR